MDISFVCDNSKFLSIMYAPMHTPTLFEHRKTSFEKKNTFSALASKLNTSFDQQGGREVWCIADVSGVSLSSEQTECILT